MSSPVSSPVDSQNVSLLGFGITLEQVKTYLGYPLSDVTIDFRLIMTFNAAIAAMAKTLGRNLVYGSYRDTFNPMFKKVYLTETPVAKIYQVVNKIHVTPDTQYKLFSKTGLLEFTHEWPYVFAFDGHCCETHVDYVGGYELLPSDLQLALFTALQAADVYQKQIATTGSVIKRLTVYDVGVTEYALNATTASVLSDTFASVLASYLPDGGYAMGTPGVHESELMGPPEYWSTQGEGSPVPLIPEPWSAANLCISSGAPTDTFPFVRGDLLSLTGLVPASLATSSITSATGSIRHLLYPNITSVLTVVIDAYVDPDTDRNILITCDPSITAMWPAGPMLARIKFLPVEVSSGPIFINVVEP